MSRFGRHTVFATMITSKRFLIQFGLLFVSSVMFCTITRAQEAPPEEEFGPVVRAYLGYLENEQEVVDDRASRREISAHYYRRNSNRIRALRQFALSIARETGNDYLPELEAAARDEFKTLFDKPPSPRKIRVGQVLNNTFRYLGSVRTGETFYVFARLDPYEKADLIEKEKNAAEAGNSQSVSASPAPSSGKVNTTPQPNVTGSP